MAKASLAFLLLLTIVFAPRAQAQAPAVTVASRVTAVVDEANLTRLAGNTHPLAQARFDQGAAPDTMAMRRMFLVLKRSDAQEADLDRRLDEQQDPASANYHQWLTPDAYGQQFGPSDQDIAAVVQWLQGHGFQVAGVSRGRTVIEFSGTAGEVRQAFHTTMHRYRIGNQDHWANASDPEIPTALAPVVAGVNTLYNFPRQAMHHISGIYRRDRRTGALTPDPAAITFPSPCNPTAQPFCNFGVGPADFAKIYNVPNLALSPAPGTVYNGDGQIIAIMGGSEVDPQDVATFRQLFGLPAAHLNIVVNGPDPGFDPGGLETEADLDVEWAGAVAPNATIDLVIAQTTEASLGVDLAAQYAVDNDVAPVLSESFGICEFFLGTAGNQFYSQLWQQAAAEGITVTVSSGDGGSAACDQNAGTVGAAQFGLTVSGFTSTPYNVSVGGTDFNDINNFGQFWNVTPSDTPTVASALGYIPEVTWNDSCTNAEIFPFFGATSAVQACNNPNAINFGLVNEVAGSGGASNCTLSDGVHESSCSGGYGKPSWQSATGVPTDGKRDVPDVSLFASDGFNSSFYLICERDLLAPPASSCDPFAPFNDAIGVGGTSASAPAFAAMMSLVNQATGTRQGNANYILYKLYGQAGARCSSAANPSASCVFYDTPTGSTIAVPCRPNSPNIPTVSTCSASLGNSSGVLGGYNTGTGYDQATGLGSVNAANLISSWKNFATHLTSSTTTLTVNNGNSVSITHGASVPVAIAVSGSGGTPTGSVSLIAQTGASTQQLAGTATLAADGTASFQTDAIPGGASSVFASYPGDGNFGPSVSTPPVPVSVGPESSKTFADLELFDVFGNLLNANATSLSYGSGFTLFRVDVGDGAATGSPTGVSSSCSRGTSNCPTGVVSLMSTGPALAASSLALNSHGYAEIQQLLPTGSYAVTANYPGDGSYAASTGSANFTVSKGPTTCTVSTQSSSFPLGQLMQFELMVQTTSFGAGPTGPVTYLADGSPLTNVLSTTYASNPGQPGSFPPKNAQATIYSALADVLGIGTHSLVAQYPGDQNYAGCSSSAVTFTITKAQGLVIVTLTTVPLNVNVAETLGAAVDGLAPLPAPTGTFLFLVDGAALAGTVSYATNGSTLIGTASYTPTTIGTHQLVVNYSGDAIYAAALGNAQMPVVGPDFSVAANPVAVTISAPGQSASTTLTFTSQLGLSGSGALASSTCGAPPSDEVTCSLSAFSLPADGYATATLTITTTAPSSIVPRGPASPFLPWPAPAQGGRYLVWLLCGLYFAALIGTRLWGAGRRKAVLVAAVAVAIFAIGEGCGGGGGGGGARNPGTPVGVTPLSVSITINGVTEPVPVLDINVQ